MPRINLSIPKTTIATVSIPVRISDINYGNHVGNDAFVSILHEARMMWLKSHDYTEINIEGIGLIMSELAIEFKKESFYGDQIEVKLFAGETTRVGFELYYQLFTLRDNNLIHLANAKSGMVCYDYAEKKVVAIPTALKQILHINP